jgi:phage recombination protein Bet
MANDLVKTNQEEQELIEVLQSSLYPGASQASVKLVLGYCKASGLDPLTKPVHIVPMWDKNTRQMREVIMPGIDLYRTKAARTGQHAGTDEPTWGPMIEVNLDGQSFTVPEWCGVVVYRIVDGQKRAFCSVEYWIENYATAGKDSNQPNQMWKKRPRGQLAKCAEAQALRKGFPEVGAAPTAEEMEGKSIGSEVDITPRPMKEDPVLIATQAMQVEDSEERERLIADIDAVADMGTESLKAAWNALTPEYRRMHGGLSDATKARAKQADAFMEQQG